MGWNSGPCESNTCVGVAIGNVGVVIWDTKTHNADGSLNLNVGPLSFSREEWAEFIAKVKAGDYDV
jgi:Domain of unknown function (DUF397)